MEDFRLGGPQKQLIYFLRELIDKKKSSKYQLILPIGSKKVISKFLNIKKIKVEEVDINYLSKNNILRYFLFFIKDFLILKKKIYNYKKIYLPGGTSNLKSLLISCLLKKKIFFHIHDTRLNILSKFTIFCLRSKISQVFFASNKSMEYYKNIFKRQKKIIVNSSIDPKIFKSPIKNRKTKMNIGIVANVNPDKNLELLIEIIKKIKNNKFKFILIGKLWESQINYYKKNLNSFNEIKNKLTWYKKLDKPEKIMKKFHILLCTSKFESLPLSIIESLSLSVPVISSDVGDVGRILNYKNFKCGYIVKNNDPNEFIKIMFEYLNYKKKYKQHCLNARKIVSKKFSIVNYAKKMENNFGIN